MRDTLILALAQLNPTLGDIEANGQRILAARDKAAAQGADLVITPELSISGYPPEDLVLKDAFLDDIQKGVHAIAQATATGGPAMIVGAPWRVDGKTYNAALLLEGGTIAAICLKHHLPNYGVFDEARIFAHPPLPQPISFRGVRLGVLICEDMWHDDVALHLKSEQAEILIVVNGSPFEIDKENTRRSHAVKRVQETGLPLIYVNQIGGQDELVFDGASFAVSTTGQTAAQLASWREDLALVTLDKVAERWECRSGSIAKSLSHEENLYQAMMLGLRDYVVKNGFPGVVLGLSGGIDSALCAAIAVDALGAQSVRSVMMPSPYTSQASLEDAHQIADLLGIAHQTIAIDPAMRAFDQMLDPLFTDHSPDLTEENIQARLRGMILMAISNKFGPMVLSTGNKSEMSVGYSTLYGDMCGGFAVLKDLYKTTVFNVSRWRNGHKPEGAFGPDGMVMPERVITKPPSAELRPNQTDQDSLPPYEILDGILHCLIEHEMSVEKTVAKGYDRDLVRRVWRMLDRAEYKRRQAPPGVKLTSRSFGRDRRYPITNAFTRRI